MTEIHYFDSAATTPMSDRAIKKYTTVAKSYRGNPSALHQEGIEAKTLLEELREKCAKQLDVPSSTLHFTSGATESNAIIVNNLLWKPQKAEIILTNIEHPSIKGYGPFFRQLGWKVIYLDAPQGFVRASSLAAALTEKTRLVSCMLVNNVVGSIQEIESLVAVVRDKERSIGRKIHFHTDAVQALGKIPFSLSALGVDSASFSAHKLHGPRGVGILYNKDTSVLALNRAGEQEQGLRGGTENLSGIASMVLAIDDALADQDTHYTHVAKLKTVLRKELSFLPMLSPAKGCSPYILTVSVHPWPSEMFTRLLYAKGFCLSSGSACSNNVKQKNQGVLVAMNIHPQDAKSSLRISLSGKSTLEQVMLLAQAIKTTYKELA